MNTLLSIARAEWKYWLRSKLVLNAALLFIAINLITVAITALRINAENHAREHHQEEAETTFLSQPDRHPHRMVHYGHYVFRSPAPLAIFDPGLDPVTGQAIFLEGHRQNSATFSQSGSSADFGGLSWLSPALMYQFIAPLLIILLAHGSIVREREAGALVPILAQGTHRHVLVLGKALALFGFITFLLLPLLVSGLTAMIKGEQLVSVVFIALSYFLYLSIWALLSLIISSIVKVRGTILALLASFWMFSTIVLPSIAANTANQAAPIAGKIETDLEMLSEKRKLGDGHNSKDPAFTKLKDDLLKKYNVTNVSELPINFRGVVASEAEAKLTQVLVSFAEERMQLEQKQTNVIQGFGWLSPSISIAGLSRAVSGTDLIHYHAFLRQAESTRFEFVQGLNQAHVDQLSYQADINRNKDEASWQAARVDASNWAVLNNFTFEPANSVNRIKNANSTFFMLCFWFVLSAVLLTFSSRSLKP